MTFGEDTFVEQDAPAVHVKRGRPTMLSVALQVTDWLVGVGNVHDLTTDGALQINRHTSMIDRPPLTGQGPKPPTHGTDLHTTASPTALTRRDLGPRVDHVAVGKTSRLTDTTKATTSTLSARPSSSSPHRVHRSCRSNVGSGAERNAGCGGIVAGWRLM